MLPATNAKTFLRIQMILQVERSPVVYHNSDVRRKGTHKNLNLCHPVGQHRRLRPEQPPSVSHEVRFRVFRGFEIAVLILILNHRNLSITCGCHARSLTPKTLRVSIPSVFKRGRHTSHKGLRGLSPWLFKVDKRICSHLTVLAIPKGERR